MGIQVVLTDPPRDVVGLILWVVVVLAGSAFGAYLSGLCMGALRVLVPRLTRRWRMARPRFEVGDLVHWAMDYEPANEFDAPPGAEPQLLKVIARTYSDLHAEYTYYCAPLGFHPSPDQPGYTAWGIEEAFRPAPFRPVQPLTQQPDQPDQPDQSPPRFSFLPGLPWWVH